MSETTATQQSGFFPVPHVPKELFVHGDKLTTKDFTAVSFASIGSTMAVSFHSAGLPDPAERNHSGPKRRGNAGL